MFLQYLMTVTFCYPSLNTSGTVQAADFHQIVVQITQSLQETQKTSVNPNTSCQHQLAPRCSPLNYHDFQPHVTLNITPPPGNSNSNSSNNNSKRQKRPDICSESQIKELNSQNWGKTDWCILLYYIIYYYTYWCVKYFAPPAVISTLFNMLNTFLSHWKELWSHLMISLHI